MENLQFDVIKKDVQVIKAKQMSVHGLYSSSYRYSRTVRSMKHVCFHRLLQGQ